MNCYKTKADKLAEFICRNWHFCPIDENITISECEGWNSNKCKECILKNAQNIEVVKK